ncbi:MAG: spermidine/putrescine ABC transporter permease [Gammaproteobacteria bacterium GWE2_42_36]|nr:MAG: spermidine/putrescine ABC transporter permease [Gammaproteobacteria bacterium GWE2_42_36]
MKNKYLFKRFSISIIVFWLIAFSLLPFFFTFLFSFLSEGAHDLSWPLHFTIQSYVQIFHPIYFRIFVRSFELAFITSAICLLLGFPFSYFLAKMSERVRTALMFFLIIPFWTSSLIRIYAIIIIIRAKGLLNHLLLWLGIIHHPLQLLYTDTAVMIGLVYSLLPFMILPLYANLEKFDWRLLDAARDLGATGWQKLVKVVIPLTVPGIVAGVLLVLLPAMTMFYIPDILGGSRSVLLGNLIKDQFVTANNWPFGSTISVVLTLLMGVLLIVYWKVSQGSDRRELL